MEFLVANGYKFHDKVMKTYSGNNKYYACEECNLMKKLKSYRKSKLNMTNG